MALSEQLRNSTEKWQKDKIPITHQYMTAYKNLNLLKNTVLHQF